MNQTLEQYRSSLYGLILDYRDRFSEQVIATLSQYVPESEREEVSKEIRSMRELVDKAIEKDEATPRYTLTYLERMKRHEKHRKAYEADTTFTP